MKKTLIISFLIVCGVFVALYGRFPFSGHDGKIILQEDGKKKQYCHSQSVDWVNPVLSGVKKIVLTVDVLPTADRGREAQEKLPGSLRKENLEKLLKELYTERFSSRNGTYLSTATPGCHDRNDQPVIVVNTETDQGRKEFEKYTNEDKTLSIILHVHITHKEWVDLDVKSDIASFYLSQLRSDVGDYKKDRYMFPFSITLSTSPAIIEKYIKETLGNRILRI